MSISVIYLANRFLYRLFRFFYDWYAGSAVFAWRAFRGFLLSFDDVLAVRVMLLNLFQPLYQDYTSLGYVLGFIFRVLRIALGVVIYPVFLLIALTLYLLWASIPLYIIYLGFG